MQGLRPIFSKLRNWVRLSKALKPIYASNAPLENLRPEIRLQLLSILDLEELEHLVHASPIFHQQYLSDLGPLLCKCLETTLRSITPDACSVYWSGTADFSARRTREKVTWFLEFYDDQRSSSTQYSIFTERFTEDEAMGIVAFYSSIIKPLVRLYTNWALTNLADESKEIQNHKKLSSTEDTRLLRGLFRFQLYCKLFAKGHHINYLQPWSEFRDVETLKDFICIFEPWEIEEIACIYTFSKEKYNKIFDEIRWDVHKENPKFEDQQRPPTPDGAFDLDSSFDKETLLEGTISHGLELLYAVFVIRDHAKLVSTMQRYISAPSGPTLEDALSESAQYQRRSGRISNRDRKQDQRNPLPFSGDSEDKPPLAWTLIWRGIYSNLYGDYYVPEVTRRWAYVMWDVMRLEYTNAREVLARQ